ncbi:MAG: hypothetical protein ACRDNB_03615 [Gaiellaceae bacterium]
MAELALIRRLLLGSAVTLVAIVGGFVLLFPLILGFGLTGWPFWHDDPGAGSPAVGATSAAVAESVPFDLAFGEASSVPPVPRAGERFEVTVDVEGRDSVIEDVNEAIRTDALVVSVTLAGNPVSFEYGADADGRIYVRTEIPRSAAGKPLTVALSLGAGPTGEKIVSFTVAG